MSPKFEAYEANDDAVCSVGGGRWAAQTFTPSTAHKITSVKLYLWRSNTTGTLQVVIQGVDGALKPDGVDLCSGTYNIANIGMWPAAVAWHEITLGAGATLQAGIKYCIVAKFPEGDTTTNYVGWRHDGSSPTYAGGAYEESQDSGVTWTGEQTSADRLFSEWGDLLAYKGSRGFIFG